MGLGKIALADIICNFKMRSVMALKRDSVTSFLRLKDDTK